MVRALRRQRPLSPRVRRGPPHARHLIRVRRRRMGGPLGRGARAAGRVVRGLAGWGTRPAVHFREARRHFQAPTSQPHARTPRGQAGQRLRVF